LPSNVHFDLWWWVRGYPLTASLIPPVLFRIHPLCILSLSLSLSLCVCVCVCVCLSGSRRHREKETEKERERERERACVSVCVCVSLPARVRACVCARSSVVACVFRGACVLRMCACMLKVCQAYPTLCATSSPPTSFFVFAAMHRRRYTFCEPAHPHLHHPCLSQQ
jgi:hypothetical protein